MAKRLKRKSPIRRLCLDTVAAVIYASDADGKHSRTPERKEFDHQVIHYSLVFDVYIVGMYFCTNAASTLPPPNQSVAGIIY